MTSAGTVRRAAPRVRRGEPGSGLLANALTRGAGLLVVGLLLAGAAVLSLAVGNYPLSVSDVFAALTGSAHGDIERIVMHVRVPRTLTGLLAGAGFGIAGAVMQGLTRNPLAGPGILGINAGASLAVVFTMAAFPVAILGNYLWSAFAGAAASAVFVYTLGSLGRGGGTPVKLALAGSAFTAMVGSVTTAVNLLDSTTRNDYRFWAVGSLTRADTSDLLLVAPFLALGLLLACVVSRNLNMFALGQDMARSLGTRLLLTRTVAAFAVVLLAGAATAVAGPIAFVGLVVPHVARALIGPDYRWIMPWSVLLAPIVLLLADVLGRLLVEPEQLRVGIVTGLAGAPFFLYLVRNRKVAQL